MPTSYFLTFFRKVPGLSIPTNGTPVPAPVSLNLNSAPPSQPTPPIQLNATPDPESPSASMVLGENGLVVDPSTDGDWSYDPNEPRYCVCNQVSYGDMVACDNEAVSIFKNKKILYDSQAVEILMAFVLVFRIFSVHLNGSIIHVLA